MKYKTKILSLFLKKTFFILLFVFVFFTAIPVFAQNAFGNLEQNGFSGRSDINPMDSFNVQTRAELSQNMLLSGESALTDSLLKSEGFAGLFNTLFQIIVTLGAIWAVIELTYYGARYALIDSFTGKKEAIKNIWPVAYGLMALLATYILFKQINPKLLEFGVSDVNLQNKYNEAAEPQNDVGLNNAQQRQVLLSKRAQTKNLNKTNAKLRDDGIETDIKALADQIKQSQKYCRSKFNNVVEIKDCVNIANNIILCAYPNQGTAQQNAACSYVRAHTEYVIKYILKEDTNAEPNNDVEKQ